MKVLVLSLMALTLVPSASNADCWRLPSGQILQTAANSSPPVRGAQRVPCPQTGLPAPRIEPVTAPPARRGIETFDQQPYNGECTDFARSRVPRLPGNLFTIADKRAIINDRTARVGSVAIIDVPSGTYAENGHVAVVENVTANSITIAEAHFGGPYTERRRATGRDLADAEAQLRIIGYFRP